MGRIMSSCYSVGCDIARVDGCCDKPVCYKLLDENEQLIYRGVKTLYNNGWIVEDIAC